MAKQKTISSPGMFGAAEHQALRTARKSLNELIGKMDRARACGADCSQIEVARQSIDDQLAQIEALFMTPAPTH